VTLKYFGDPIFRQRAEPVGKTDDAVRLVVDEIVAAMDEHGAIGLSAVHVGHLLRIVVIRLQPSDPIEVYINPVLSDPSPERETGEEGSISWSGVRAPVERPRAITVTAQDLTGNTFTRRLEGLHARVLMHENDQLNGVMFVDRVKGEARRVLPSIKS
jgi:peptide deformylase